MLKAAYSKNYRHNGVQETAIGATPAADAMIGGEAIFTAKGHVPKDQRVNPYDIQLTTNQLESAIYAAQISSDEFSSRFIGWLYGDLEKFTQDGACLPHDTYAELVDSFLNHQKQIIRESERGEFDNQTAERLKVQLNKVYTVKCDSLAHDHNNAILAREAEDVPRELIVTPGKKLKRKVKEIYISALEEAKLSEFKSPYAWLSFLLLFNVFPAIVGFLGATIGASCYNMPDGGPPLLVGVAGGIALGNFAGITLDGLTKFCDHRNKRERSITYMDLAIPLTIMAGTTWLAVSPSTRATIRNDIRQGAIKTELSQIHTDYTNAHDGVFSDPVDNKRCTKEGLVQHEDELTQSYKSFFGEDDKWGAPIRRLSQNPQLANDPDWKFVQNNAQAQWTQAQNDANNAAKQVQVDAKQLTNLANRSVQLGKPDLAVVDGNQEIARIKAEARAAVIPPAFKPQGPGGQ